jgi:hypothetical protein
MVRVWGGLESEGAWGADFRTGVVMPHRRRGTFSHVAGVSHPRLLATVTGCAVRTVV